MSFISAQSAHIDSVRLGSPSLIRADPESAYLDAIHIRLIEPCPSERTGRVYVQ